MQLRMLEAGTVFLFGAGHVCMKKNQQYGKTVPRVEFASKEIQTLDQIFVRF